MKLRPTLDRVDGKLISPSGNVILPEHERRQLQQYQQLRDAEMTAYDKLPRRIRMMLAETGVAASATTLLFGLERGDFTEEDVIAQIAVRAVTRKNPQ